MDEVEAAATTTIAAFGRVRRRQGPRPFGFDVIDLELAVAGYPAGLDGGQVDAGDGGGRIFVGELDGPDSGAGAEVEDGVGGRGKGAEVKGAV